MSTPREKVLTRVESSGFPLELRAAQLLQDAGYYVAQNHYYIDLDENKGREIDLRALKNFQFTGPNNKIHTVRYCLLVECKRALKGPWAILSSPTTPYDPVLTIPQVKGVAHKAEWMDPTFAKLLVATHPLGSLNRYGRTYLEPMRDVTEDAADRRIFGALTTVVKATVHTRDAEFAAGFIDVCFYHPVVLVEGELWDVFLKDRDALDAVQADVMQVAFSYESPSYQQEQMQVAIVTWNHFPEFIRKMDATLELLGTHFQKNIEFFVPLPK